MGLLTWAKLSVSGSLVGTQAFNNFMNRITPESHAKKFTGGEMLLRGENRGMSVLSQTHSCTWAGTWRQSSSEF